MGIQALEIGVNQINVLGSDNLRKTVHGLCNVARQIGIPFSCTVEFIHFEITDFNYSTSQTMILLQILVNFPILSITFAAGNDLLSNF